MFLFNKNTAVPRSRQSSIDSLVTDPSTSISTATSEAWVSQCSDTSSYGDLPSPEQSEQSYPRKRNSVFNLRSRSNTTTSTSSSFVSVTPAMVRPGSSRRTSQDLRHMSSQNLADVTAAKRSIFARGKKGKRLSTSIPSREEVEEDEEYEENKRASVLRKNRKVFNQPLESSKPPHSRRVSQRLSSSSVHQLKNRISSPFDFKHLTHTDRHQFPALEEASENELVAEFRAVRNSQAPRRDLTGIKADDLHFKNFSSENLSLPETVSSGVTPSPTLSHQQHESQNLVFQNQDPFSKRVRTSRSVESFSQPGINARIHRHTQSANHPARSSSRLALAPIHDSPEESGDVRRSPESKSPSNRHSGIWDMYAPLSPIATPGTLPPIADEGNYFGEAVTTPDDTAIHATTPPFSPLLEDVAEEPEKFISPRPAPPPPMRSPKSPRSISSDSSRARQRTPLSRSSSRGSPYASPKSGIQKTSVMRPMSQMSDTLGSPAVVRRASIRRPNTTHRKSNTWRVMDDSWEDDVDYIYDNALEADCDFDWDDGEAIEDRDRTPEQQDHHPSLQIETRHAEKRLDFSAEGLTTRTNTLAPAFRPSLIVPSPTNVPELESRSAVSASTTDTGIRTPSDLLDPLQGRQVDFTEAEGFTLSPSLLVPRDFKEQVLHEEIYDSILADYECGDQHFPLLEARQSVTGSTRSSHLRSSKRSSYDSSLMSSGQGSVMWGSPIRRSASSSGSLPELVHSRRARKDFDMMVDTLSEQVASMTSFGEESQEVEDDDTTPPGRPLQERSFFANEEEDISQTLRASIEGEMKASLELARQGSTRSSRAPAHAHKYASSDGVAKMLASPLPTTTVPEIGQPPKKRNRAATSSNAVRGNRQAYLSLFPAPPRYLRSPTSPNDSSVGSP